VAWTWRYQNSDGLVVTPDGAPIAEMSPTQADAETWLGEIWRDLLDAGVDAVVLLEDGREVYGPMSLHAE
jgi:predicted regulator of Ras-like GTPase activity (Roadblock/LC7/MglB family)